MFCLSNAVLIRLASCLGLTRNPSGDRERLQLAYSAGIDKVRCVIRPVLLYPTLMLFCGGHLNRRGPHGVENRQVWTALFDLALQHT